MRKIFYIFLVISIISCKSEKEKRKEIAVAKKEKSLKKTDSLARKLESVGWDEFSENEKLDEKYFIEIQNSIMHSNRKFYFQINVEDIVPKNDSTFTILGNLSKYGYENKDFIIQIDGSNSNLNKVISILRSNESSTYSKETIFAKIDSIKYSKFKLDSDVEVYSADDYSSYVNTELESKYLIYGTFLEILKK